MANSKNAAGAGTIRKKIVTRKGKEYQYWEGRITLGTDNGTGKQIQKSFTGKTQAEVRKAMSAAAAAVDDKSYFEASKMTFGAWLDTWLSDYQSDKKYLTTKQYRAAVESHIKPALGAVKLSDLTSIHIQKFYNKLLKSGKQVPKRDADGKIIKKNGKTVFVNEPLASKSVRNIHGCVVKALNVAVDIKLLRDNPAERVTLPRVEKAEIKPLDDSQVTAFLKAVQGDDCAAILQTILFTGMRESEAIGLCWNCVDFDTGVITLDKQLQKRSVKDGGTVFTSLKNGKARTVTAAPSVLRILEQRAIEQKQERLRAGEAWTGWQSEKERKTSLVFTTATGSPITPTTLRRHFKAIAEQIGAPECRVHDLRHSFAVLSLQNGDSVKTVQENLGHATAAFTLDVYGHVSDKMKRESAARMEQYIKAVSEG